MTGLDPRASSSNSERRRFQLRDWSLATAVVGTVLLTFLFAFWPEKQRTSRISWKPESGDKSGALVLSRGWPSQLTFSAGCDELAKGPPSEVLNTGGLTLRIEGSRRIVLSIIGPAPKELMLTVPREACTLRGGFRSEESQIWLRAGSAFASSTIPRSSFPTVVRLVSGEGKGTSIRQLEILTRPTGLDPSQPRQILGVLAFLFLAASALIFLYRKRKTPEKRTLVLSESSSGLSWSDAAVLFFLVVTALLQPTFPDDSWTWLRLASAEQSGVFSNLLANQGTPDAWLPQGFLHESLLLFLAENGFGFLSIRLIVVGVLTLVWILMRLWVLEPLVSHSWKVIWPSAAGYVTVSTAYLVSLRAEPWVVVFLAFCWVGLAAFIRKPSQSALMLSLAFGVLAVVTHQSALAVVGPVGVICWLALRSIRSGDLSARSTLLSLVIVGLFGLLMASLPFSFPTVIESWRDWATGLDDGGMLNELTRFQLVFNLSSPPRLFVFLCFSLLTLALALWLFSTVSSQQRMLLLAVGLSYIGLLFTSSKWEWHLAALAPAFTVLVALATYAILSSSSASRVRLGSVSLTGLLVFCAMVSVSNPSSSFGYHDFGVLSWGQFSERVGPEGAFPFWVGLFVLLGGAAVLGKLIPRDQWVAGSAIAISVVLVTPISLSMAWIAADVIRHDQWTLAEQNLDELSGTDGCGTLRGASLVGGQPRPLEMRAGPVAEPQDRKLRQGALPVGLEKEIPVGLEKETRPFPNLAAWGSFGLTGGLREVDRRGRQEVTLSTPIFELSSAREISFWTKGANDFSGIETTVNYLDENESIIAQESLGPPESASWNGYDPSVWRLNNVRAPVGARFVTVSVRIASPLEGQWIAVSSPSSTRPEPARSVLSTGKTFVGPFEALHVPCVVSSGPEFGYWPKLSFLIRDEQSSAWIPVRGDEVVKTSIGCSEYGRTCVERLQYNQAEVSHKVLLADR